MKDDVLTSQLLADKLRCSVSTVARDRALGRGPKFIRHNGRVLYRISDVEEWMDANVQPPSDDPANSVNRDEVLDEKPAAASTEHKWWERPGEGGGS